MADSNAVRKMQHELQELKIQRSIEQKYFDEFNEQLDIIEKALEEGGDFDQLESDLIDCEKEKTATEERITKLNAAIAKLEAKLPREPEPEVPKFDREKHPLLKTVTEKVEVAKPVTFNTGDLCEAQWNDRKWYTAKVQMVLGSASDPKYRVGFVDYAGETATVDSDKIRQLPNEKKRKAEGPPTPNVAPVINLPHIISGPATNAKPVGRDSATDEKPTKTRKIGGNKALERKASAWKDFNTKGAGKKLKKKDSMFRTGDGINARVGFTGSGAGMRETVKRERIRYKAGENGMEEGDNRDDGDD